MKMRVLRKFTEKHLRQSLFYLRKPFFTEHLRTTASELLFFCQVLKSWTYFINCG